MVVSETVLHANDNPIFQKSTDVFHWHCREQEGGKEASATYHKFVKTTPKPRATKNKRGELVGPPPPPLPSPLFPVLVGTALELVWEREDISG